MPNNNSNVIYKYGTQSAYNALETKDENTIYFITDTHKIYVGSTEYSGGGGSGELTEGSYGDNANATLSFGGTVKVPKIEVDENGKIENISDVSVSLPTGGNFSSAVTVLAPIADMNPATKKYVDDALDGFTSPVSYYATYGTETINNLEVDNVFTLYEVNDNNETIVSQFVIQGGGQGGSGSISTVSLTNNNNVAAFAVPKDGSALIKFTFTSTVDDVSTGNCTCKISVNGQTKSTTNISQGYREVDVGSFLVVGENTVSVTCTDIYGNYRTIVYTLTVIELKVSSTFDDTAIYDGNITFKYTPYGLINKTVHIIVDNNEVFTNTSTAHNQQSTQVIPAMSHGIHRMDVYLTATLDGVNMESNHLIYDVMCVENENDTPFIASPFTVSSASEGELISIPYTVYDPTTISCDITLSVYTVSSGNRVTYSTQEITVDRTRQVWNTRRYPTGTVYFEIAYPDGNISKTHTLTVAASSINVQPVTNDLEVALLSAGRSNSENNPAVWTSGNVTTTFTNVNWSSSGWIEDNNGDVALRLGGGSQATIQFSPFDKDLRTNGKTIEMEFSIHDVNNRDAIVADCLSGGIGFRATADRAVLQSEQTTVECRYKDNEKVRIAFVIESRSEYRMMSVYLNGVLSGAKQYPSNDNFQQSTPVNISLGSVYCTVDIYAIRIYDTALSTKNVTNNYIADITDIAEKVKVYENNNIYDNYGNLSYNLMKPKIPVMTIIGTLPTYKGDKKTATIIYEDPINTDLNFTDTCTIDVQGTSSQWYVRKNWKLKFPNKHQHAPNMLSAKTFCMKVDYAEGTGTHNTQNANLVDTLYVDKVPAQNDDSRIRTAIYGVPCVIFHKETAQSDPVFYGKANFNYDKGAENIFGFTSNYDVECWEFKNNTSDVCNFNAEMPVNWDDDFEARYPEDNEDISRLSALVSWIYSTKNNLTKFKNEFENYFNKNYTLTYYVYTFVMLMVDQRAKNMMFTYWDSTGKWYPYCYDNDTCLGINNEGVLCFDYYHEDTDQMDGANVFNGQNSVLWNNVRQAFASEIKSLYQNLRSSGKITYDVLCDRFITQGSDVWSESIYNEDSDFKYVSMLRSDNDSSNLYQIRGDGEQHFKYFVKNRLDYCDSKWYAGDYANDYISLRIYTPQESNLVVEPDANITVTPFSNMYAGVRYKANGTLQQQRATKNTAVTFTAPNETFNDTETAIYGASNLSSLGDLSPLYCGSINVSKAIKLTTLKIGDSTTGYSNPNLTELSVGTNRLLKTIDVRNCPNLTNPLALANCPNIENIYAEGSGITGVELPNNGYLKTIHLPDTIRNLTLKNQIYITDFSIEDASSIKTLWIENCPTIDEKTLLNSCTSLERLRLVGVNWTFEDNTFLHNLIQQGYGGIDETGTNTASAFISGTCYIPNLTGSQMAEIQTAFPYLEVTYDTLTATVYFMSEDGQTQYTTATAVNGANVTYSGTTPTKTQTAQYTFTFDGWSSIVGGSLKPNILNNVETDRYVYAHFANTTRTYTVRFYNDTTLLQTNTDVPYGTDATYTGAEPVYSGGNSNFEFVGWNPSSENIQGDTDCYAQFVFTGAITDSWATISQHSTNGDAANYYAVGDVKEIQLSGTMGTLSLNQSVYVYILGFNHNPTYETSGITFGGFKSTTDLTDICLVDSSYNTSKTDGSKNFNMSHWGNYNYGGWSGSDLRYDILGSTNQAPTGYGSAPTTSKSGKNPTSSCATNPVSNTLMSCLPSDLRTVMKPITKYTDNTGNKSNTSSTVTATTDYLPLLSEFEVFGTRTYANETEQNKQVQYAYFTAGNSKVKYRHNDTSSSCIWWLRSPYYFNTNLFCGVYYGGSANSYTAYYSLGVAPAFLI